MIKETKTEKADALCRKAHQQKERGNTAAALRLWRSAAQLGDSSAMHALGYFYDVEIDRGKHRDMAMHWYKRSYRRGCTSAAINIGTIYRDEEDYVRAFAWFGRAVKLGDLSAHFEIARVYMDYLFDTLKAAPHLRIVAKAKPVIEVSEWEQERAQLLLDGIAAQKQKRASRKKRDAR